MVDRRLRDEEDDTGVHTVATRCEGRASCDGVLCRRIACSCAHLQRCEETVLLAGVALCVFSERGCWCCVHPQCVLSSSWWSARDCPCPRISNEEEGAIGSLSAVRL